MEIVLTKALEWAAGKVVSKALDVGWRCLVPECAEPGKNRIENVAYNTYYCINCRAEHKQFTNACRTTVLQNRHIAHVAAEYYVSEYTYDDRGNENGIVVYGEYIFQGLAGQQLRLIDTVLDPDRPRVEYCRVDEIWVPQSDFEIVDDMEMFADFRDVPSKLLDGRTLAFEYRVLTRFNEVLFKDRWLDQAD